MFDRPMTWKRAFILSGLSCVLFPIASGPTVLAAEEPGATALTIYSSAEPGALPPELYNPSMAGHFGRVQVPGYAVVKQERPIELTQGRSTVRFTDVAAQIDPTTVSFQSLTDPGTRVLEQNYQFDLVSADKIMERYLDQIITVEQATGEQIQTFTGKLLSTSGGVILQKAGQDKGVEIVRSYTNAKFPELPGGLITKPTLVWDVATDKGGPHRVRVTYQTSAMTWWTDYNITFAEGADANSGLLDLGAWVSIINRSGATYNDARLKLIAGEVHRAPRPERRAGVMKMAREMAAPAMDQDGFEEKAFFEYYLYTLGRPTTLPDNSTKQIELFPVARGVPCEKVLVYYGLQEGFRGFFGSPMSDREFGTQCNKKIDVYLRFKNEQKTGLGMPLPAGRIRVSKLDPADNSLEFIGEDAINHTPKDEEVLIKLGSAFDVVGERTQTDFQTDSRRRTMDETVEIKLRNHKTEPVKVIVKENLYRWTNWQIVESTHKYEKADARTIHFPVTVDKDGEVVIRYKVHYSW
ncbi:MAG TPA: DUF4139 domain-containing protein [Phycisphaerae bacterium]|nr:DUF4139 domain-containing protein [Phycisphaerae bacterium]